MIPPFIRMSYGICYWNHRLQREVGIEAVGVYFNG